MFTLLDNNFQWRKAILKHFTKFKYCIAYRYNIVSRRNYELIQEPDEDTSEVQVNVTGDNEDLNVNPESEKWTAWSSTNIAELTEVPNFNSEELTLTDSIDITKGKPRCIISLF